MQDLAWGLARGEFWGKISIAIAAVVAFSSLLTAVGVAAFLQNQWPSALDGTTNWHGLDLLVLTDLLFTLVSFFIVGTWIYRAHANLMLTDAPETDYTPGWAVGWFAIPIANLFKPFQAMKALWRASHGLSVETEETAPGLLWAWWLTWIVSSLSGFSEEFGWMDVGAYTATSVSAICLILIIQKINDAQPTMSVSQTFE